MAAKKYIVTAIFATLPGGIVTLTTAQASTRSHNLKPLDDGRYEIVNPVQFKAGEEFGYDGELPKALAETLVDAEVAKAEADADRKPEGKGKGKARTHGGEE